MLYFTFVKYFLNCIHTQQPVPTLTEDHTPDVFSRFSESWGLSIANWCRIGPPHDSSEGVRVSDATLRGCRLLSWFHRRVCACLRWSLSSPCPPPCPPRQKIVWVPLGTGWGLHPIPFWTLKEHMYVTTSIEQHIHAFILLKNIWMLETSLGLSYSSQAVRVLMYVC